MTQVNKTNSKEIRVEEGKIRWGREEKGEKQEEGSMTKTADEMDFPSSHHGNSSGRDERFPVQLGKCKQ